ncbi:type II toxin-antitoxin system prevent-host-death family antitoxin [Aquabacterium sp. A7-Y]|uniref:type II toxin-antitoxin system Phd/YefM family antitoxin n=1 Tax=Aquabacterium sp. A7-Y TaxID=1349605 RepID=UPI00223DB956|nr:type II toxin-antitoxin system prevent-host-death family antitoxin [Aquabacterium sp. A7-Y]MCW7538378.1 type II toxin-antitoxin system prevent-host-death family antitoxin [Aquabacterium sp. A7-Y]
MDSSTVGAFEAKTHLSALLERVEQGEEIVITRHGRPIARLAPIAPPSRDPVDMLARARALRAGHCLEEDPRRLRDEGRR